MPDPNRLDEIFRHARAQLDQVDSVRPQVEQRIAGLRPTPAVWSLPRLALAALALAVVAPLLWWRHVPPSPPPAPLADLFTLQTDSAELTEHLSAFVDGRAVVVLWSYRGPGVSADPTDRPVGRYRLHTLRQSPTPDGRTLVCSVLTPAPGVQPVLDPPSLTAKLPDDTLLAFSASPRPTSAADLAAAVRSAGLSPEQVRRAIDDQAH